MKMDKWVRTESIGTHAVFFYKEMEEDWGYMGMSDHKSWNSTGKYSIEVVKYSITGRADNSDAGITKDSFRSNEFGKEMANKIFWNIKNGISYNGLLNGLKKENLIAKEA